MIALPCVAKWVLFSKVVAFVAVVAEFAAATGWVLLALRRLRRSLRAVGPMLLSNVVGAVGSILKDTLRGGTGLLSTIGDSTLRGGAGTVSTIGDSTLSGGAVSGSDSLVEVLSQWLFGVGSTTCGAGGILANLSILFCDAIGAVVLLGASLLTML